MPGVAQALLSCALLAEVPALEARRAAAAPVIDGRLDEPAWNAACWFAAFRQVLPEEGGEPSERTEVAVLFDRETLYVAVRCLDRAPGSILARSRARDAAEDGDDVVRLVLDPFGRGRDGYYFSLTAAGGRRDGLIEDQDRLRIEWDGIWEGRVARDAAGWSAEFAIPTRTLTFDGGRTSFGFNLERVVRRREETVRFAGTRRVDALEFLPAAGTLTGLSELSQGRGIDVRPYLKASRADTDAQGVEGEFEPGADLLWRLTPSLLATFSWNTDFADTEVDERQVNLSRFPLFFPEKRAFFLQDAPLFAFGNIDYDPRPFYSRRIGLDQDGRPVDVEWGVKFTGRTGPVTLGVMDAQVAAQGGVDSKNLLVARGSLALSESTATGVLLTRGEPRANGQNRVLGVDWNWVEPDGFFGRRTEIHSWLVGSDSDLAGGESAAGAVQAIFPNEPFDVYLYSGRYGERYDPGLGFVPRPGIHEHIAYLGWIRRYAGPVRRTTLSTQGYWIEDLDGELLDTIHTPVRLDLESARGDLLELSFRSVSETLATDFEIRPDVTIAAGEYAWRSLVARLASSRARPLDVGFRHRSGDYYDGRRRDYELALGWRPSAWLELEADLALFRIELPDGAFDARVESFGISAHPTPDLSLSFLTQYDNFSEELAFDLRSRWSLTPASELFLVLGQIHDASGDGYQPTAGSATVKWGWTWSL